MAAPARRTGAARCVRTRVRNRVRSQPRQPGLHTGGRPAAVIRSRSGAGIAASYSASSRSGAGVPCGQQDIALTSARPDGGIDGERGGQSGQLGHSGYDPRKWPSWPLALSPPCFVRMQLASAAALRGVGGEAVNRGRQLGDLAPRLPGIRAASRSMLRPRMQCSLRPVRAAVSAVKRGAAVADAVAKLATALQRTSAPACPAFVSGCIARFGRRGRLCRR